MSALEDELILEVRARWHVANSSGDVRVQAETALALAQLLGVSAGQVLRGAVLAGPDDPRVQELARSWPIQEERARFARMEPTLTFLGLAWQVRHGTLGIVDTDDWAFTAVPDRATALGLLMHFEAQQPLHLD